MEYYAIAIPGRTRDNPSGLARRRHTHGGDIDESFRRNLTWEPSSVIVEWELGDIGHELYGIDEAEAMAVIERWRVKWGASDQG